MVCCVVMCEGVCVFCVSYVWVCVCVCAYLRLCVHACTIMGVGVRLCVSGRWKIIWALPSSYHQVCRLFCLSEPVNNELAYVLTKLLVRFEERCEGIVKGSAWSLMNNQRTALIHKKEEGSGVSGSREPLLSASSSAK